MASPKYKVQHCLQKDSGKCRNAWCETTFQVGEKSLDAVYEDKSKKNKYKHAICDFVVNYRKRDKRDQITYSYWVSFESQNCCN